MTNIQLNPASAGFFDSLLIGVFGKDDQGNVKTFDLSKIIKLPEVVLKADEKQARTTGIVLIAFVVALFLLFKMRKNV